MSNRLKDKVILISGAGGGLGTAQVKMMAKEGAKIVAGNLKADPLVGESKSDDALWNNLNQTIEEINAEGGEAIAIPLDVTVEDSWKHAVEAAKATFGRLDVLSNNAGIYLHAGLLDHTTDDFFSIVKVNQLGVLLGMKAAIPLMRESGGGSIINFSSIYGIAGAGISTAYQSTKGAVRLMTKSAAMEFVGDNIRINAICPGMFDTNLFEASVPKEAWSPLVDMVPMKRFGRPEEIAYAAVFLASDESSFMTGTDLVVDGGYTCP